MLEEDQARRRRPVLPDAHRRRRFGAAQRSDSARRTLGPRAVQQMVDAGTRNRAAWLTIACEIDAARKSAPSAPADQVIGDLRPVGAQLSGENVMRFSPGRAALLLHSAQGRRWRGARGGESPTAEAQARGGAGSAATLSCTGDHGERRLLSGPFGHAGGAAPARPPPRPRQRAAGPTPPPPPLPGDCLPRRRSFGRVPDGDASTDRSATRCRVCRRRCRLSFRGRRGDCRRRRAGG